MRDTLAGALSATAYVLKVCQKTKSPPEIKRKVEDFRDWLLKVAADEIEVQMPRQKTRRQKR